MIFDHTPEFHAQQDELARQMRLEPRRPPALLQPPCNPPMQPIATPCNPLQPEIE